MNPTRSAYFFQSMMISVWWIGMIVSSDFYQHFEFSSISRRSFLNFALPDFGVIVSGSLILAFRVHRILQSIVLGGFLYASLYCLSASIMTRSGYLATTIMLLGSILNIHLVFQDQLVIRYTGNSTFWILVKTYCQSFLIWLVTLMVIPGWIIVHFDIAVSFPTWQLHQAMSLVFFTLFSLLGLWSGYIMSVRGLGTPLPLDAATKLVISGPYAYVRNPMAIAGLGQGFCVAFYFQSVVLACYVIIGLIVWNQFVRPIEEVELENHFGKPYRQYRSAVPCWIPRRTAYQHDQLK